MTKLMKFLNSALGIWMLTSLIGGFGVWHFEKYIDHRKRVRELNDKYDRLSLEFEGRLSQYSVWFLSITEEIETDSLGFKRIYHSDNKDDYTIDTFIYKAEIFKSCVTKEFLVNSIRILSGTPNNSKNYSYIFSNDSCLTMPKFQSIFDEYEKRATIGLLAEMRLINDELYPIAYKTDPEDGALYISKNAKQHSLSRDLLDAINSFLNPYAIVPEYDSNMDATFVKKFRRRIIEVFYRFGPGDLWYGDTFAG